MGRTELEETAILACLRQRKSRFLDLAESGAHFRDSLPEQAQVPPYCIKGKGLLFGFRVSPNTPQAIVAHVPVTDNVRYPLKNKKVNK